MSRPPNVEEVEYLTSHKVREDLPVAPDDVLATLGPLLDEYRHACWLRQEDRARCEDAILAAVARLRAEAVRAATRAEREAGADARGRMADTIEGLEYELEAARKAFTQQAIQAAEGGGDDVNEPRGIANRKCCYVDATGVSCSMLADFEIGRLEPAPNPEGAENTDACTEHVGALLGYVNEPHKGGWWVALLDREPRGGGVSVKRETFAITPEQGRALMAAAERAREERALLTSSRRPSDSASKRGSA